MTCHFCGDETAKDVETDRPLPGRKTRHWKKIPVCDKERCQKKVAAILGG